MASIFQVDEKDVPWVEYRGSDSIRFKALSHLGTDVPSMHHHWSSTSPASMRDERRRDRIASNLPPAFHRHGHGHHPPRGPRG